MPQVHGISFLSALLLATLGLASCRSAATLAPEDSNVAAPATEDEIEAQSVDRELHRADCFSEIVDSPRDVVVYVDNERVGVIPIDSVNDEIGVGTDEIESVTVIRCDRLFDDATLQGILMIELTDSRSQ